MTQGRASIDDDFTSFVAGSYSSLVRIARLMTADHHRAEDLVQHTLERLYVRWHRSAGWESPHAYARQTLVHLAIRASKRRWRTEITRPAVPDDPGTADGGQSEARHDLGLALRTLPTTQRLVLVLRYYEDLTIEQTAHVLGCTAGTVKSRTNRALATLRGSGALSGYATKERR